MSLPGLGATDTLLAEVAAQLEMRGLRLCGTVQTNFDRAGRHHCDMDLRVLPDGPVFSISQQLGEAARGCRLHPGALEQAVVEATQRLVGTDLLIVNKFGKQEAEGHGFRAMIGEALGRGQPVLVGVNGLNLAAFEAFAAGLADSLPPEAEAIVHWVETMMASPMVPTAPIIQAWMAAARPMLPGIRTCSANRAKPTEIQA